MKCPHCLFPNSDEASFCAGCGQSLQADSVGATSLSTGRSRPKWLVPLIAGSALLCAGAFAGLSIRNATVLDEANSALVEERYSDISEILADLGLGLKDEDLAAFLSERARIAELIRLSWGDSAFPPDLAEAMQNHALHSEAE